METKEAPESIFPIVSENERGISVSFSNAEGIVIFLFSEIEYTKSDRLEVILRVNHTLPGATQFPFEARLNIFSLSSMSGYAHALGRVFGKSTNWDALVLQAANLAKETIIHKDTAYWAEDAPANTAQYLLNPFLLAGEANLLFGKGGTGKTYIALRMAISLALEAPFLMETPSRSVKALFVDYESTGSTIAGRLAKLRGAPVLLPIPFDHGFHSLRYFPPAGRPLADLVPTIRRIIAEHKLDFVIIDSAALACGGEPEKAETAVRYFNALAQLKITSLTIAHETKAENHAYPFGSVVWWNSPRNIWNVRSDSDAGDAIIHATLAHRKANDDRRHEAVGVRIYFGNGMVDITQERVELDEELSLRRRIWRTLSDGPKTKQQVIEAIPDANPGSVHSRLTRDKSFMFLDGFWTISSRISNDEVVPGADAAAPPPVPPSAPPQENG